MGMNMVTKGVHNVIEFLTYDFPYMDVIEISGTGNHSKLDQATWQISILKDSNQRRDRERELTRYTRSTSSSYTICDMMCFENISKSENKYDCIGGAQYAQEPHRLCCCRLSIGGFNTHASKIVFDILIATCQDPAQNMESSQGSTMMKPLMGKIYNYLSLHHLLT
uniref:Uncharacterized protein n=1 Tax=Brassica oleracea var. oleracea TaxID=109376 RepID=A0A0D3DJU6_BRAOL